MHHVEGSHHHLKRLGHPEMRVVIPIHKGRILKPKTLRSILDQAGWTVEDLIRFL